MSKRTYSGSLSAGAKKTRCLDTAGESSSADTESTNASTQEVIGNPTPDTDDLDIPDSLTLARVDRENQGPWEAEYSYGGEADLHQHLNNCNKNPGHKNFIPVDKFSRNDLPEGYRHPDIVKYIRVNSDLTVRVTVNYVSDSRPATVPVSGKPYPGYDNRGQRRMTVGTGWVFKVKINLDRQGKTCKCKDCRNSSTPESKFAVIYVATAKHVVFDDLEAENTTCHLFFDSGGTPEACRGVVTLTDMKCRYSSMVTDQYYMKHFTHDLQLGERLLKTCRKKDDLIQRLRGIIPKISMLGRNVVGKEPLLFIVSHPHGCRKHIGIGRWTSVLYDKVTDYTYEYTAATCPGSSGALVVMPHGFSMTLLRSFFRFIPGAHCGTSEEQPGVNYFKINYAWGIMMMSREEIWPQRRGNNKGLVEFQSSDLSKRLMEFEDADVRNKLMQFQDEAEFAMLVKINQTEDNLEMETSKDRNKDSLKRITRSTRVKEDKMIQYSKPSHEQFGRLFPVV